jgi:hypothetical protein
MLNKEKALIRFAHSVFLFPSSFKNKFLTGLKIKTPHYRAGLFPCRQEV